MMHTITLISALIGLYVVIRIILPLRIHWLLKTLLALLVLAGAEKLFLTQLIFGSLGAFMPRTLMLASGFLQATVLIMFLLVFVRDVLLLLCWPFRSSRPRRGSTFSARKKTGSAAGAGVLIITLAALLTAGYGLKEALRTPAVREVSIQVPNLPPALSGMRIVQLSDLHIGPVFGEEWLRFVVAQANALNPDLIAITGDAVDGSTSRLGETLTVLGELKAPRGVFLVPGNHEYYSGLLPWTELFRKLGITVLLNENTRIQINGTPLAIAGITDPAAAAWELPPPDADLALKGIPEGITRIMLSHRPDTAPDSARAGASLQLSGHTHGGLVLPLAPLVASFNGGYVSGLYDVNGMPLYVSNGAGLWGGAALRLFVPSEITVVTLTR